MIDCKGLAITSRAAAVWQKPGVEPITPHEARHTLASLMIAAGINAKALSTFMGHGSVTITLDCYGHPMPGSEDEAAEVSRLARRPPPRSCRSRHGRRR